MKITVRDWTEVADEINARMLRLEKERDYFLDLLDYGEDEVEYANSSTEQAGRGFEIGLTLR